MGARASSYWVELDFSSPVAAIGFYGIDVGDFGGRLQVRTKASDGTWTTYLVSHSLYGSGGDVLYFGLVDPDEFVSVKIGMWSVPPSSADWFGIDDLTVGTLDQVSPPVPEPASLALFGLGAAGLVVLSRRRRRAALA